MLKAALAGLLLACLVVPAAAETCSASYYGPGFHGRKTASGERFNQYAMTAASRTLPMGARVKVTLGKRSVVVRINDRGPYAGGRCIDLSYGAAKALDMIHRGVARVSISPAR